MVHYVDLPVYGRPMSLAWKKHRMRCVNERCTKKTWMLSDDRIAAKKCLLTTRAAKWATRQIGDGRTVKEMAAELACDWHTVNEAVTTQSYRRSAAWGTEHWRPSSGISEAARSSVFLHWSCSNVQTWPWSVGHSSVRHSRPCLTAQKQGLSGALVLRGEAGVGKTALLDDAAESGGGPGHADRSADRHRVRDPAGLRGAAPPAVALWGRVDRLPGPQRDALQSTFGLVAGPPADRFMVALGVLTLLADVATEEPLSASSTMATGSIPRRRWCWVSWPDASMRSESPWSWPRVTWSRRRHLVLSRNWSSGG